MDASGLIHVYGPPGSGKTIFALSAARDLKRTFFLDGDTGKSKELVASVGLPKDNYYNLTSSGLGMTSLEYQELILGLVEAIPGGQELIIYDNPAEFFKGGHSYVHNNRTEFKTEWHGTGDIIGGLEWQETRLTHFPRVYSQLLDKAELVIICTHEKEQTDQGVKTGLLEPRSDPSLRTAAGVVIRLAKNTRAETSVPCGLVVKNLGNMKQVKGEWVITKVLPDRIPTCNWKTIQHYLENPIGDREPTPEETPDEFELSLITGSLNQEQRRLFEWRRQVAAQKADEAMESAVRELRQEYPDKKPVLFVKLAMNELGDEYPNLTEEKIEELLGEMGD